MMAPPAIVSARNISKSYGSGTSPTRALLDVSVDVFPGEMVLLFGPSGSGKTSLISILAGLLRATGGQVSLCGVDISQMPESQLALVRRQSVGFIFQGYNLFRALSARDNIAEILALRGMPIARARESAVEWLGRVGLAARTDHLPSMLSGGERQRVAIARALAGAPRVVFGDEPTAALDGTTARALMELLRAQVSPETAMVLVTHDTRLEKYADRIVELEDGRVVRSRPGEWRAGA